ncbi:uncharacterized protein [Rutidosis leptorrhynchoides]|uniref:uncharacterized protein isoform X2 n=1 Tax=Rutidosis leptorrhynchoides TaxID=125765 RepID=UPI003A99F95A
MDVTATGRDTAQETTEDVADNMQGTMKKRKKMNLASEDEIINFCNGFRSTCVQVSCCSSISSSNKRKASDLEGEIVGTDTASAERHNKLDGSKRPKLVESKSELDELETIAPEAEIEEFFVAAQKDLNKRFKDKYNYDILNDIPIEGRFEWIQVKPGK